MGKYFGTDGFRGEANVGLTAEHALKVGMFLGAYYSNKHDKDGSRVKIVIGKDTRRSSYMLEHAVCAGITACGADVYMMHVTTTPSVSYITRSKGFACGVMISASHNPFADNGIKLVNSNGEKMEDDVIEQLEAYLDGDLDVELATGDKIGCVVDYSEGRDAYADYIISLSEHSLAGKKIALDCSNGSTWQLAERIFKALGADTYVINNHPDGLNVNMNCGSTHIDGLLSYVKENGLDVGFAFDGDADRCLASDENGKLVNGDEIMYVCAKHMQQKGVLGDSKVVTTVMSNFGLYKALDGLGIGYEKTAVGDKYVYENMSANNHLIGGEQSGHIIFRNYATTGDGLLTAVKLMECMLESGSTLSQLVNGVCMYPQVLKNVVVTDKDATMADPDVQKAVKEAEAALGDRGRVLLRKSGTEPVLRVMAEADTDKAAEEAVDHMIAAMKEKSLLVRIK